MFGSVLLRVAFVMLVVGGIVMEESVNDRGQPVSFQVEVTKMLDILIHSLYTNRDVFLREIISNGSDALDKIRLKYLEEEKAPVNQDGVAPELKIHISVNKEKREVVVRDGGVGMTKQELTDTIGSLGSSGTKGFLEAIQENADAALIGQFGVGFYSVFLVSESVQVASKHDDEPIQYIWESSGDGQFYIYEDPRGNTLGRGTELRLHLKPDADAYLSREKIRQTVHRYSEFIHFPILLHSPLVEDTAGAIGSTDKIFEKYDVEVDDDGNRWYWEQLNENTPIWTRNTKDVTADQYRSFYKQLTSDYDDPVFYTHFSAEGEVSFNSLLFIPANAPKWIMSSDSEEASLSLYVRRVFISDKFPGLLPRYLCFVRGVVDSDDLPLNVSREVLQETRVLSVIRRKVVRKIFAMLDKMAKDSPDTYHIFWVEFGGILRSGIVSDIANRPKLLKLLRYATTATDGATSVGLDTYISRMLPNQDAIYYIAGESVESVLQSPLLEDADFQDVEVILMTETIDEIYLQHVKEYKGYRLVDLSVESIKLGEPSRRERKIIQRRKRKFEPLMQYFKELIGHVIHRVTLTKRRTREPFILSTSTGATANMNRIMKGQTVYTQQGDTASMDITVEVNYNHPLVDEVFKRIQIDPKDEVAAEIALTLFDVAAIQNGMPIGDSNAFANRVGRLLRRSVDIPADLRLLEEDLSEYDDGTLDDDDEAAVIDEFERLAEEEELEADAVTEENEEGEENKEEEGEENKEEEGEENKEEEGEENKEEEGDTNADL